MDYAYISTIGQDSHRFKSVPEGEYKVMLAGVPVDSVLPFEANSDGDVILHAVCNAISGITGVNILGGEADKICLEEGNKDSRAYLEAALKYLTDEEIVHVSISVECLRPKLKKYITDMKKSLAGLLGIPETSVGITATTGEGLTGFGKGEGVQALVIMTFKRPC